MPADIQQIADTGAQPAPEVETTTATAETLTDAKDVSAESSPADKETVAKPPNTLLDAIKAVLPESAADASTAAETAQADTDSRQSAESDANPAKKADADANADKPEAGKEPPFHTHPRWKEMLSERDALKPRAEEYDRITQYMQANGLSVEETAQGYAVMAAIKNDPVRAFEMLAPIVETLRSFTGDRLPEDIRQRAEDGIIDPDSARELAQRRAQDSFVAHRNAEAQANAARWATEQATESLRFSMKSSVTEWENAVQSRDVDYPAKQPLVLDRARRLIAEENPQTPEAARSLAQRAYEDVTKELRSFLPARRPAVTQTSQGIKTVVAQPAPTTLREVIQNALQRGG